MEKNFKELLPTALTDLDNIEKLTFNIGDEYFLGKTYD